MALDIFQVEDNRDISELTQIKAKCFGLSYFCASNYEEIERNITHARIYIVDCNFPRKKGEIPELLAEKAIEIIRKNDYLGKIVLFSADHKSHEIAKKNGVSAIDKTDNRSLDTLLISAKSEIKIN